MRRLGWIWVLLTLKPEAKPFDVPRADRDFVRWLVKYMPFARKDDHLHWLVVVNKARIENQHRTEFVIWSLAQKWCPDILSVHRRGHRSVEIFPIIPWPRKAHQIVRLNIGRTVGLAFEIVPERVKIIG